MLIITGKRKDCFDMFTHRYGVDPLLVFNRVKTMKYQKGFEYKGIDNDYEYCNLTESALAHISMSSRIRVRNLKEESGLDFLSIFGAIYPVEVKTVYAPYPFPNDAFFSVVQSAVKRRVLDKDDFYQLAVLSNSYHRPSLKAIANYYGKVNKNLLSIHREIGIPWFIISDNSVCHRSSYTRTGNFLLNEIGFDRIVDPETIYQELSLFLGGIKNQNPTVELADIERCAKAGFDKKTSFRKRKEQKSTIL